MKGITARHRKFRPLFRVFLGMGVAVIFLLNFGRVSAVALEGLEVQIKGAMIVNFIRFVKWPPEDANHSGERFIVGVLGSDPMMEVLKTQEGKIIDGKALTIQRFDQLKGITECHILFVGDDWSRRINEILNTVQGVSVLTIGDAEEFCRQGGMIRLFREKNNIRFEINNAAAVQANLQLSSKLLEIATVVSQ